VHEFPPGVFDLACESGREFVQVTLDVQHQHRVRFDDREPLLVRRRPIEYAEYDAVAVDRFPLVELVFD
jgi:hypothetical protein